MSVKNKLIYLDHAAATPMDPAVVTAVAPYFSDVFFNPSANYSKGLETKQALEAARSKVASILGVKASEITFTAGGSEANNLAIHGVMREYPGTKLVVSAIEHDSILRAAEHYDHDLCPVDDQGIINIEALSKLIDDQTVLVSIMYVNNEIGTIEPLSQIASLVDKLKADRLARGIALPLYFHTDACQAANYLDLHISRLGVDLMTLNGGKIYGPKQTGVLAIKSSVRLKPIIDGGGQEHGLRSGTENVAGIIGFSEALQLTQDKRKDEVKRLEQLRDGFIIELQKQHSAAVLNGSKKHRVANNIHFSFPGIDNERLLIKLDELGILAAAGSACSASNQDPSHVLKAIGLNEQQARSSIRLTIGRSTTEGDLKIVLKALKSLI